MRPCCVSAGTAARLPQPERADVELGEALTIVTGPNGAGKTNLLEALYFGCTARSCRTANEREVVRFGREGRARRGRGRGRGRPSTASRSASRRASRSASGWTARRSSGSPASPARPLVSVFMPDRLELVKGAPALPPRPPRPARRGALAGPRRRRARRTTRRSRSATRWSPASAAGRGGPQLLDTWDAELARHGIELMAGRAARPRAAGARLHRRAAPTSACPSQCELRYRPRSTAADAAGAARRARRAPRERPRARLHGARPAPRRPGAPPRRPLAARVRLAGPAASRRCSRSCSPSATCCSTSAAARR